MGAPRHALALRRAVICRIFSDGKWRPFLKPKTRNLADRIVTTVLVLALGVAALGLLAAGLQLYVQTR